MPKKVKLNTKRRLHQYKTKKEADRRAQLKHRKNLGRRFYDPQMEAMTHGCSDPAIRDSSR